MDTFDKRWRGKPVKTVDGDALRRELDLQESHSYFPNVPPGWRIWPTSVYLEARGCYAWQVDTTGHSEVITFSV